MILRICKNISKPVFYYNKHKCFLKEHGLFIKSSPCSSLIIYQTNIYLKIAMQQSYLLILSKTKYCNCCLHKIPFLPEYLSLPASYLTRNRYYSFQISDYTNNDHIFINCDSPEFFKIIQNFG